MEGALERGVIAEQDLRDGDLAALGRPFFALPGDQQRCVADIVIERERAMRWLWNDFKDWWQPSLDS